jgi:AraC family transcriptional regulator of adaptative response/methylated-DNA-[protein]-cysteine methyltransferase
MNMVTRNETLAAATVSDSRWAAVAARDRMQDGKFVYSVKTTGVYCRPSCAARPARPENVAFHLTAADAGRAGFRPCKRCKPDQAPLAEQHTAKVGELCKFIEEAEQLPTLDELAARAGLSAYHLHRVFKQVTGLTPRAYAAAHRAKRMRDELGRSDTVTQAIYGAGYGSNGRFYEESDRVLGMTPSSYRAGGADTEIRFVEAPRLGLDLPLDVRGTAFQQRVWQALREIPAGKTASYTEIARRIDAPKSVRAVAQACAANPLAVAIPCHRVVRNDGGSSGYRWGVERKRALLERESKA